MRHPDRLQSAFLIVTALGLVPIALSYGIAPDKSLWWLFGIDATDINTTHVFRAVMGLYLAFAGLWIAGALTSSLRLPALWSLVAFMVGLALGRILSIVVDGWPHPLLVAYTVIELIFAAAGWWLLGLPRGRTSRP